MPDPSLLEKAGDSVAAGRQFLGSYRLVRLVRSGHTCQVWDAVNDVDGRRVALKALQQEYRSDREQIDYLKHEFEVGKGLDHPTVIKVYEFGTAGGVPHLVMELFTSKNLKQAMRAGVEQLAPSMPQIIEQAAEGLNHLHEKGWIHCDVKPDNFLVNDDNEVRLIDFALARKQRKGLAKLLGGRPKVVQGTRSYMSPEQIRLESLDTRADIYSFGCMVYELLSGKLPFAASTPNELLTKHLRAAAPSVAGVNHNVTPELAALIQSMMAKKREERPDTLNEFLKTFERMRVFRTPPKAEPKEDSDNGGET